MEKWLIWCHLNVEQDALEQSLGKDCVSIRGTTPLDERERLERLWREGDVPIMITKPSVFGWGMNWQHCANVVFVGTSDSFEEIYQAERRTWRFGQQRPVHMHYIVSELEGAVVRNIERKQQQYEAMVNGMLSQMRAINTENVRGLERETTAYDPSLVMRLPAWVRSEVAA